MADTQLKTVTGSGTQQTLAQSPQTAGHGNAGGTRASSLQPGTATSVLSTNHSGGVQLQTSSLPAVRLGAAQGTTKTATVATPVVKQHHISTVAIAIPAVLFLLALVLVGLTMRSAKNTTYYE